MASLRLLSLTKRYKKNEDAVLDDFTLFVPDGKTVVIIGPTGCGKTTVLKIIAGLDTPDSGEVYYGEDLWYSSNQTVYIQSRDRKIGMVFQDYALYPHYDVKTNILSWWIFRKRKNQQMPEEAEQKLKETSERLEVKIDHLLGRMPRQLSGGEKQRVAIGRCITRDPNILLLDEPFSNLDAKLRRKYRAGMRRLLQSYGITSVYVTHDQEEAALMADLIAVMDKGRIVQSGTYNELYADPHSLFVAGFMTGTHDCDSLNEVPGDYYAPELADYIIGFRPEHIEIIPEKPAVKNNPVFDKPLTLTVIDSMDNPIAGHTIISGKTHFGVVEFDVPLGSVARPGSSIAICPSEYFIFEKETGDPRRDLEPAK